MERSVAILFCVALVVIFADIGDGYALVAKRSVKPRGSLTEERGREIEERAKAGHRAVINELNERFAGYKENCFPMPKGCRCQVGDQLIRHMDERECKGPVTSTYRPGPGRPWSTTTKYVPSWRTTTTHYSERRIG